jgi:pilus assembly protein CpaB
MSLRVVVIALMMVTAIALGLIAYQIANQPRQAVTATLQAPIEPLTVSYLVAAHPVPPGTLARTDDFTLKTVPTDQVPPGAVIDSPEARAALRGSLVRHYIETGVPLAANDLMQPRERGFLAAVLVPGSRAVSIGVDPVSGVAGLIWPGDHVDVILTQEMDQPDGRTGHLVTSESVLTNVRVIAIDQDIAQGAPTGGNMAGRLTSTVTIQATTDQAERLAVATHIGHLSLAIRAAADDLPASVNGASVSGDDLSPARSRASVVAGSHVQVIQGDQRSEVNFR